MKIDGKEENREEKNNIDKYLVLILFVRYNEGMLMNELKQIYFMKRYFFVLVFKRICINV